MARASKTTAPQNAILAALPREEMELLAPRLERVSLKFKLVVQEIGEPLSHLWFPISGVVSMLSEMDDGTAVEVATTGREGFIGLSAVMGVKTVAQRTIVQVAGEGERLSVKTYNQLRDQLPRLVQLQMRYAMSILTQVAQGSACNRMHPIEARCARWLLMTHDRVDEDHFTLTHEFLAQMLGVTRPSVTIAAGILQQAGLIEYVRGQLTVLNRKGLEDASCECYRIITSEFERLLSTRN
jgi:CRP-like cAMP-binding protein